MTILCRQLGKVTNSVIFLLYLIGLRNYSASSSIGLTTLHRYATNMAKLDRWAEIGALPKNSSAYAASSSAYEPSTSSARRRRRRSRATSSPGPRPRTRSAASGLSYMLLNERVLLNTDASRTSFLASHGPNNQQVRSFAVGLGAFLPQRKNLTNSAVEKVRITYLGYCNMRK